MTYRPYARASDQTSSCDEAMTQAAIEKRTWYDQPEDIIRLMDELRISTAHRARRTTLIDITPWAFFARL